MTPNTRRHSEALAFLRTLVLSDRVAQDPLTDVEQPSEADLERMGRRLRQGKRWTELLPGLARLSLEQDEGATYNLRIVKRGDVPGVRVVRSDEAGTEEVMTVLKVNELEQYKFGLKDLAAQLGLNQYETRALVFLLGLTEGKKCFKEMRIGRSPFKRYSHEALRQLREAKAAGRVSEGKLALSQQNRPRRSAA